MAKEATNGAQQRIIAHRKSEAIRKSGCRSTAQCKREMANQGVQTRCPAGHRSDHVIAEPLGENLLTAIAIPANEPSNGQMQFDPSSATR
nr:hypothetical protein [Martelella mediterranea]